ncbi:MAG TPA: hypothetical protein VMT89_14905 [Candidatus Acidoferrales bacterium]|nr:hypothetical protein [Candidatus Acidoferrales bacterium]
MKPTDQIIACAAQQISVSTCDSACTSAGLQPTGEQAGCAEGACPGMEPCPTSEAGLCTDGLDNEPDGLIDCADPDCATDPACTRSTPTMGHSALLILVLSLSGIAIVALVRQTKQRI